MIYQCPEIDHVPQHVIDAYNELETWLNDTWCDYANAEEYSGRCMYGAYTVGIITDASGVLVGMGWAEVSQDMPESDRRRWSPTKTDNMGKGTIYYA